uniref:RNA (guanine-9-)-methyltransferase domain-containing protein 1 n=1 Tax=Clastoptera arizonana TaxID=38151 RepID=A0A1B6CHN4_9HEMI
MCSFWSSRSLMVFNTVCKRNLHSFTLIRNKKHNILCISQDLFRKCLVTNLKTGCFSLHTKTDIGITDDYKSTEIDDNYKSLYKNVDYDAITGGDEVLLKKLKIIMLEVEVLMEEGSRVPSTLSTNAWKELLTLETRSSRNRYLSFLFINEMKRNNDVKKKAIKQAKIREKKAIEKEETESNDHIRYGFGGSTIFQRVYNTTIDNYFNSRLMSAIQFGQNLVVDCSYDGYMSGMESNNCAKQMTIMFAENRMHDEPFNLHFCNADPNSKVIKSFHKCIPTMYEPAYPMNITEKSYLDIFPKENLVYLTPHCRNELTTFNHDDIYIIGAFVDKKTTDPISLAKAKREGIRMACLPLDSYLLWNCGTKNLTINQVLSIMLDIRRSGDWTKALQHVPKRKLVDPRVKIENKNQLKGIYSENFQKKPFRPRN